MEEEAEEEMEWGEEGRGGERRKDPPIVLKGPRSRGSRGGGKRHEIRNIPSVFQSGLFLEYDSRGRCTTAESALNYSSVSCAVDGWTRRPPKWNFFFGCFCFTSPPFSPFFSIFSIFSIFFHFF